MKMYEWREMVTLGFHLWTQRKKCINYVFKKTSNFHNDVQHEMCAYRLKIQNFASKMCDDAMILADTVRNVIRIHELRWKCDNVVEFVCGKMCKQQKIQFKLTLIFTWIMFFFMRIGLGLPKSLDRFRFVMDGYIATTCI